MIIKKEKDSRIFSVSPSGISLLMGFLLMGLNIWLGLLVVLLAVGIFIFTKMMYINKQAEKNKDEMYAFKKRSKMILINLKDCEIQGEMAHTTLTKRISRYYREKYTIEYGWSVIICRTKYFGGEDVYISPVIFKDKISLEMLLHFQEKTFLYVNPQDRNEYLFDLSFLDNSAFYPPTIKGEVQTPNLIRYRHPEHEEIQEGELEPV